MAVAALVVSLLSVLAAGVLGVLSLRRADRAVVEARRSADAAISQDRLARRPNLTVTLLGGLTLADEVTYGLRNNGPQNLDEVIIKQPVTDDRNSYRLAVATSAGYEPEVRLGPLAINDLAKITLWTGPNRTLPTFRAVAVCTAAKDQWEVPFVFDDPRPPDISIY